MTSLLISAPAIPAKAVRVDSTVEFAENFSRYNMLGGKRGSLSRTESAERSVTLGFDAGANNTAATDHIILGGAAKLQTDAWAHLRVKGSSASPIEPSLVDGLYLWLDANRGVTAGSDGTVSQWDDLSGNERHAAQGTSANRPRLSRADSKANWLTYSEELNNAAWDAASHPISVTANDTTDPNGTTTAEKITATAGSNRHGLIYQSSVKGFTGINYRVTCYLKYGNYQRVWLGEVDGGFIGVVVDLSAGTIVDSTGVASSSITSVGGGWYRVVVVVTRANNNNLWFEVGFTNVATASSGPNIFTAAGTEYFYAWGAQLNHENDSSDYLQVVANPAYGGHKGERVIWFDGNNDSLTTGSETTDSQPWTVFVAGRALKTDGCFVDGVSATHRLQYSGSNLELNAGSALSSASAPGSWKTFEITGNGGSSAIILNGSSLTTGSAGTNAWDGTLLGVTSATTNYLYGQIGEVLVYTGDLSSDDRARIRAYLEDKWQTDPVYEDNSLATATLYGPDEQDYVATWNTSDAARQWWVRFDVGTMSTADFALSKLYLGEFFDIGKEPDYEPSVERERGFTFRAASGAETPRVVSSVGYRTSLRWDGVSDAEVSAFFEDVVERAQNDRGFFLYTATVHKVLDYQRLLYCELEEARSEYVSTYDWNRVEAVFSEMTR